MIPRSAALSSQTHTIGNVRFTALPSPSITALDKFLTDLSTQALRGRMLSYTGTGVDGQVIDLGFPADFLYIHAGTVGSLNGVLAMRQSPDVTFIPGSGQVAGAVKEWTASGVIVGTNANVNTAGQVYHLLAIG